MTPEQEKAIRNGHFTLLGGGRVQIHTDESIVSMGDLTDDFAALLAERDEMRDNLDAALVKMDDVGRYVVRAFSSSTDGDYDMSHLYLGCAREALSSTPEIVAVVDGWTFIDCSDFTYSHCVITKDRQSAEELVDGQDPVEIPVRAIIVKAQNSAGDLCSDPKKT